MQTLQLLFILPFVQYTASSPLPNKPIGQVHPHNHRNHPRSADPSPQFDDPPIWGPGPGDFCDPPTTITATVPGPAATGGAQLELVTSTVTVTAKGVDTGLFDGIFGPINIGQSVKPERVVTVTMEASTAALPGSAEIVTMRVAGSEVAVTGEASEVTITVSANNTEDIPSSTITANPTSTATMRDAVNTRESMPTLSGKREDEAPKSEGEDSAESPIPSIPSHRSFVHLGGMRAQALKPTAEPQALNINPEETPIPSPLLPQSITHHNVSTSIEKPASTLTPIVATPTGPDSPTTTSAEDSSTREFSRIRSSPPAKPSIGAFGEDVEDLDSHENIVALAAELGIGQVRHPSGFAPDYSPKKTATLAPPAATTVSR